MSRIPWRVSLEFFRCSLPMTTQDGVLIEAFRGGFTSVSLATRWCNTLAVLSPPSSPEKRAQVRLKVLQRPQHGLSDGLIPESTWGVLENLHRRGYDTYLVGGSVRDLLLNQVPKDFDILSTAEPIEVKRSFRGRCIIVGRRFPICHVDSHGTTIEVSSFSTNLQIRKKDLCKSREIAKESIDGGTEGWDERDFARWENSLKRDFTINGLMYDPFKQLLYDYVGGLRDLRKLKVRTVIPADESFNEDCARILRAIRIAARLGFRFTKSTARAIKEQRFSLLKLNKGRLMLEANMFFSYGAAEPSLRLLWRYGVLELLLPFQAAYFVKRDFKRRDSNSNFLLDLLRSLDKVVAPDRPCHGSLWVALLAFHLAVVDKDSSPMVTATAALIMYYRDKKQKAAGKARRIQLKFEKQASGVVEHEVNDEVNLITAKDEEPLVEEATILLEQAKWFLNRMMDSKENAEVMQSLTGVEPEDSAAVAQAYSQKALGLFRGATREDYDSHFKGRIHKDTKAERTPRADPVAVTRGDAEAICYLFSRIVLKTLYPRISDKDQKKSE